jgi:hypothetical protein
VFAVLIWRGVVTIAPEHDVKAAPITERGTVHYESP